MATTILELIFFVERIEESVADELAAEDVTVAWGPNYCTASVWRDGEPATAAKDVAELLRQHGVAVRRLSPVVVNAAGIADRCSVSAPTVYEWTRADDFPEPYVIAGAPLWLWHDVMTWVRNRPRSRVDFSNEPDALPLAEVEAFNRRLAEREHARRGVPRRSDAAKPTGRGSTLSVARR